MAAKIARADLVAMMYEIVDENALGDGCVRGSAAKPADGAG
jgi:hypothetical protein